MVDYCDTHVHGTMGQGEQDMGHSLRQAAEISGKSRTTIHRALKSGKVSGIQLPDGTWDIDPSELNRVFPNVTPVHAHRSTDGHGGTAHETETKVLQTKVALLEQQLEREQDTVSDLRRRLDKAEDRLIAITDQTSKPTKMGWFDKLLGR